MARLFVVVEGETEETFVNVTARLMGNARLRSRRGGIRGWPEVRRDIVRHLQSDRSVVVTTMVDYYGLPKGGNNLKAWPGREHASRLPFAQKADHVESEMAVSIQQEMGGAWNPRHFIPFVMMHEFEGLLFSDCQAFAMGISRPDIASDLQAIRDAFPSPEEINDSWETSPSHRIKNVVQNYNKPFHGNIGILAIGLDPIRMECSHFRRWLERLEGWGGGSNWRESP